MAQNVKLLATLSKGGGSGGGGGGDNGGCHQTPWKEKILPQELQQDVLPRGKQRQTPGGMGCQAWQMTGTRVQQ